MWCVFVFGDLVLDNISCFVVTDLRTIRRQGTCLLCKYVNLVWNNKMIHFVWNNKMIKMIKKYSELGDRRHSKISDHAYSHRWGHCPWVCGSEMGRQSWWIWVWKISLMLMNWRSQDLGTLELMDFMSKKTPDKQCKKPDRGNFAYWMTDPGMRGCLVAFALGRGGAPFFKCLNLIKDFGSCGMWT